MRRVRKWRRKINRMRKMKKEKLENTRRRGIME
jgi:hypothetical protein